MHDILFTFWTHRDHLNAISIHELSDSGSRIARDAAMHETYTSVLHILRYFLTRVWLIGVCVLHSLQCLWYSTLLNKMQSHTPEVIGIVFRLPNIYLASYNIFHHWNCESNSENATHKANLSNMQRKQQTVSMRERERERESKILPSDLISLQYTVKNRRQ